MRDHRGLPDWVPGWRPGDLRGQWNLLDRVPQWRDGCVPGQRDLLNRVPERGHGNLRGQRNMLDRIPQWRDKHVRSQWGLFDGISQRRDRHMRGQLNLLDRLQQLFGNVLGQNLSRQRRAGRRVFIEPRLHCGLWLQEPDGRPGWGLFAKHIVLGTQMKCSESGKDVSDKAGTCPMRGA